MSNPYSAGGGGTHLEARIVAAGMAAVLCEAGFRGLPGDFATKVLSQRADFGDPLDDIVIYGIRSDGQSTQLHLQIKNTLTFGEGDKQWADILGRAWETFEKPNFDGTTQHIGVGVGTYHANADKHFQSVLKWALNSPDADNFFERIEKPDYSHEEKRSFVRNITNLLTTHVGRQPSRDELWRFLKAFVILHFDFQTSDSSRDAVNTVDRLKEILAPEERAEAAKIWNYLIAKAGELIPAGGGVTRPVLVEALKAAPFPIAASQSYWRDVERLRRESARALSDIKSTMHGLRLHRAAAYDAVREALADGRFIQINGEPGSGKSALFKDIAEECERHGPVLVLKDTRIHPKGWSAHAHILGVSDDIVALLREFSCCGEPILFIDGIDKIVDPAIQLTVNDILKAIAHNEELSAWRILVTVREQNLKHLETWLDGEALKKLPLRNVAVASLNNDELAVVASVFPRLSPLLSQEGGIDVILSRPFFLEAMLSLASRDAISKLPATEVELLKLWWELGGSDRLDFSAAQHRRNVLLNLADRLSLAPSLPIAIRDIAPEQLEELKSAGVIRDKDVGHSVVFAHDIYEEWALCQLLISPQLEILSFLMERKEPDLLIRPMQLRGAYALETDASAEEWKKLYEKTGESSLRPVWQRAILTSCIQSTRTTQLLATIADYLQENEAERLKRLLLAISTLEVIPNPLFFNETLVPDLEPETRAKYAHLSALPKAVTWVRFLNWLVPKIPELPITIVPNLIPVLSTWQSAYAGHKVRLCRAIGNLSYQWLKEIESANHPNDFSGYRAPFGNDVDGSELEKTIRSLFLSSAGDVPEHVKEYLEEKANGRYVHMFREGILKNSNALVLHLPKELVDYILKVFLRHPEDSRGPFGASSFEERELGLEDHFQFYPASPIQQPFLGLLRLHEDQGLRLIRSLCNYAIDVWRWIYQNGRRDERLEPLPIQLEFLWGKQEFWGDQQVYLWFRGVWGNDACQSGLMALEQWALEQIDRGVPFEEIFRKVIEGNDTVAALGVGVSLCLAHPDKSLMNMLPLVTCPHLWQWDVPRYVHDVSGSPSNEIGNWFQNRPQLQAVRNLNNMPHRKQDIRHLTPRIILSGNEDLLEKYTQEIRSFPDRLPFTFADEREIEECVTALKEQMEMYVEQGDPQFWKWGKTEDGKWFFYNDSPRLKTEEYRSRVKQHAQLGEAASVAVWAHKTISEGKLQPNFTVEAGLAKAKQLDTPDLFDAHDQDDFDRRQRASAVSGVAFVVSRHCADEAWNSDTGEWCISVLERAATSPNQPGEFQLRRASFVMHPAVAAAHGYSALVSRGYEVERCQQALLSLAVDPIEQVQSAVIKAANYYAGEHSRFFIVILDMLVNQCIIDRDEIPDSHSLVWDEREAGRMNALMERAEVALSETEFPKLPSVPMPWKKGNPPPHAKTDGFVRNDRILMHHLASKTILQVPLQAILSNSEYRAEFLNFAGALLDATLQEIVPPFAKHRREHRGNTPYEWVYEFSVWCGRLCAQITRKEAQSIFLSRMFVGDNEAALFVMQSFLRGFMLCAFLLEKDIPDERVQLWDEMANWLFENPEWKPHRGRGHLDREFQSAAFCLLFCIAPDFSPLVCGADRGWPHIASFTKTLERAVREFGQHETLYLAVTTFFKRGGFDLLPNPGLEWIHGIVASKKQDIKFWESNGEDTVELLKALVSEKSAELDEDHRRMIVAISDVLVDNGVRGAGFLQQELVRTKK